MALDVFVREMGLLVMKDQIFLQRFWVVHFTKLDDVGSCILLRPNYAWTLSAIWFEVMMVNVDDQSRTEKRQQRL